MPGKGGEMQRGESAQVFGAEEVSQGLVVLWVFALVFRAAA